MWIESRIGRLFCVPKHTRCSCVQYCFFYRSFLFPLSRFIRVRSTISGSDWTTRAMCFNKNIHSQSINFCWNRLSASQRIRQLNLLNKTDPIICWSKRTYQKKRNIYFYHRIFEEKAWKYEMTLISVIKMYKYIK